MTLTTLLFLLGVTLLFVGIAAAGIFWAIRNGQYDDMEGPAQRILMDDDDPRIPFNCLKQEDNRNKMGESPDSE